jgi:2-oxoisovalerate dehydrogenase E2 component (dihydrolipoyl transacylase)
MTELKQFKLPDVGEGLTEADIVKWRVQPGDRVTINQVIVEIETAKAVVELPSPFEGVVADLLAAEGATVDVGTPILSVSTGEGAGEPASAAAAPAGATAAGGAATSAGAATPAGASTQTGTAAPTGAAAPPEAAEITAPGPGAAPGDPRAGAAALPAADAVAGTQESAPREERQAVLVGYGVKLGRTTRRPRKPAAAGSTASAAPAGTAVAPADVAAPAEAAAPAAGQAPADSTSAAVPTTVPPNGEGRAGSGTSARALAKPPVRKLARDLGVDLGTLTGSGPQGSITRHDVQQAVGRHPAAEPAGAEPAAAGMAAVTAVPREERIAIRGVRKHTAAAVTASAFTAPHVTEFLQLDVTGTTEALARLRELPEFAGMRVSPLLLAARALIVAVARHPMINSSWDEEAQEIVVHHYVNLGIAAATERGLVVPNVKDAHAMPLPELARALGQLTETARAGKTTPADLAHGTITITNVGVFGVDTGTPILTPGEAAILALGQIKDAPWVHEGELAVRKVTTLALSFDHRIVDGDLGSTVLSEVGAMMADPLRMLA